MPIRFRCEHCRGLMAISTRQAGAVVNCPTCGEPTQVPLEDEFSTHRSPDEKPAEETVAPLLPPQRESPAGNRIPLDEQKGDESAIDPIVDDIEDMDEEHSSRGSEVDQSAEEPFVPEDIDRDDGEGPLTFRRRRNAEDDMDLTPMVDVTFQLLIFFMVSASFSLQKSIEIPTPDPDQQGASQQVQTLDDLQGTSIIIKIDASNTIFVDDEPLADVVRLPDTLRDKMRREQKTEVLVTADNQSLHRTIIAVIDAANEVGMQKIRMTSRKKAD
jgi:biopolymer transport protein ExbD